MKAVPRPWGVKATIKDTAKYINLPELPDGWQWTMYYSDPCAERHDMDSYGWITAPRELTDGWSFRYKRDDALTVHGDGFSTPQEALDALMAHIYLGV